MTTTPITTPTDEQPQPQLTVGVLRQLIAYLPDDTPIVPEWYEVPSDHDPAVTLHDFLVHRLRGQPPKLVARVSLFYFQE